MTRRPAVSEARLARVIRAAREAGMRVARCEVTADGAIILHESPEAPPQDPYDAWKAKRAADRDARAS